MICNGTMAEWSQIRSVIVRVINKIGRPGSGIGVRFVYHEYDYRQLDDTKSYYQLIIAMFGINTTSGISKLLYIVSRGDKLVVSMPNITYKSCYHLFIQQPEKFSHATPSVYFCLVVLLRRRANWFQSICFWPSWSKHQAKSMHFS